MFKSQRIPFPLFLSIISIVSLLGCTSEEKVAIQAPTEVAVEEIGKSDLALPVEFIGQTKGAVEAEIRARVDGVLLGVHFKEGTEVKEGDLLYTIDPSEIKSKLVEADAKIVEAETKLAKAESDLKRIKPLAKMKAVSERDLDAAVEQEGVARSGVEVAKASRESVKIELGYTEIRAPISGFISLSMAKVGEYVGKPPNPVVLATISNIDPIHVKFGVSEKNYLYFARLDQKKGQAGEIRDKAVLALHLSDDSIHPEKGVVVSVNSQVDPSTGSIMVEAAFPNPGKILRSGQFAKVKALGETLKDVIVIPKTSIREMQGIKQVLTVDKNNLIELHTIKTGRAAGDFLEVIEGLSVGELLVSDFQPRLKTGTVVVPTKTEG